MAVTRIRYSPPSQKRSGVFISRRALLISIILIPLIITLSYIAIILYRGPVVDRGMAALVSAYKDRRLHSLRLSGGFLAGELNPDPNNLTNIDLTKLNEAHSLIEQATSEKDDPRVMLAYARMKMLGGEIDEAWRSLKRAVAKQPDNPEIHNEIGVCLFERGRVEDAIEEFDLARVEGAIEEFDLALKLNPRMPEALFNRAYCYKQLLLRDKARSDFMELSGIESNQGWVREIKKHLYELSGSTKQKPFEELSKQLASAFDQKDFKEIRKIISESPEATIRFALVITYPKMIKEFANGDRQQGEEMLNNLDIMGRVFLEAKLDGAIFDFADYLRNLSDEEKEKELGLAIKYGEATRLIASQKQAEAEPLLNELRKEYGQRHNYVMEAATTFSTAGLHLSASRFVAALQMLEIAKQIAERHKWPSLLAQILNNMGLAQSRLGNDSLAISYFEQAIALCENFPEFKAKSLQFMSMPYWHLGNLDKGLNLIHESTRMYLEFAPRPRDLANNHLQIADFNRLAGHHAIAISHAELSLTFALDVDDFNRATQAASFLAVEHAQQGLPDLAIKEINDAFHHLGKIKAPGALTYTQPLLLTRAGEVYARRGDFDKSIDFYSTAIKLAKSSEGDPLLTLKALSGRAEAYTGANRIDEAEADLKEAVSFIENLWITIPNLANKTEFMQASQDIFDQVLIFNANNRERPIEAFNISEQARARTLLVRMSSQPKTTPPLTPAGGEQKVNFPDQIYPLTLKKIQGKLPDGLAVLVYSVTSRGTYIFLVTRSGFEVIDSAITSEELDRRVSDYLYDLVRQGDLKELTARAKELYQILIGKVESRLQGFKNLCIVPDKSLSFLPFAALVDGSDQYFIKSHDITYAPSATVLVRCIEESKRKGRSGAERMLAVGNPLFDPKIWPGLKSLTEAEGEASGAASFYGSNSVVLKGRDAQERRVRSEMQGCEIAHFAVHGMVKEKSPWLAALVLAHPPKANDDSGRGDANSSDDGLLSLDEVYTLNVPRMRLVVLSACQSGLGRYYKGEGIVSLVHPFIAKGVPTVVASLWPVQSQATAEMMVGFHKERKGALLAAGSALAAMQIKMATESHYRYRHPYYWAPFIAVGSNF